jgi:NADH-quinone oxidoreductase subunit L
MTNIAYILIPALPFAAFLIIALNSRWLGERSHRLATPAVTGSFILSVLACVDVYQNGARSIPLYSLINVGNLAVEASLYVDAITVMVLLLVTGVSSLVHVFSSRYMQADPKYARFFAVIALFTSAMIMLVMSANLLMLFMFWEIMGLCSYLLISHWSRRPSACNAATKAFLVNAVADVGLAFGIYLTWATFGTVNIQAILSAAPNYTDQTMNLLAFLGLDWQVPTLSVIAFLLFMGPIGKSAQIPLHVWLPFAMEAPTPVSALIHAATMVNAGVYLLIRMGPLYLLAPNIMIVVAIIGGLTALFAAIVALTQFDIKRILAYSTISQLGFMVLACGVGAYGAAIFHLLTHGAMKSFLFLSAGSALEGLGGAHHGAPHRTKAARQHVPLYVGALILALIPPLVIFSGPYERLWTVSQLIQAEVLFWTFGLATVFFTGFYLFQGVMELFKPPGRVDWYKGFRLGMMRPRLFSASLLLGLIPMTAGLAAFLILIWSGFLEFVSPALPGATAEHVPIPSADMFSPSYALKFPGLAHDEVTIQATGWTPMSMLIGLGVAIAGWAMAFFFHAFPGHPSGRWVERKNTLYVFFLNRGYFDEVYEAMIIRPFLRFASWLLRVIDLGSINRTYMASARATATMSRWLWQVIDLGTIDRVYMASARATATMSRWLWRGVDVFLIDRPANGLATASFRMATELSKVVDVKLSKVVGGKKTVEPGLPLIMLVLLVALLVLLAVVEVLLSVIVH